MVVCRREGRQPGRQPTSQPADAACLDGGGPEQGRIERLRLSRVPNPAPARFVLLRVTTYVLFLFLQQQQQQQQQHGKAQGRARQGTPTGVCPALFPTALAGTGEGGRWVEY